VPLVGMFFVPADQSAVLRYALGGLAVLGLVWLLIYIFQVKACATYTITRKRCTAEIGFVARKIYEVQCRHIRNINVEQSLFQRLFGIGNVEISTAGGQGIEVTFKSVHDPLG